MVRRAWMSASRKSPIPDRAIRWMITSESIEVWKMVPSFSRANLISAEFTRLPLWERTMGPSMESALMGWALRRNEEPVVEYRLWPMAMWPARFASWVSSKTSSTSPMPAYR